MVAGVAAFIEVHSHQPIPASGPITREPLEIRELAQQGISAAARPASGLSPTAYDLLRISGWALLILGAVTVVLGLVRYWAHVRA